MRDGEIYAAKSKALDPEGYDQVMAYIDESIAEATDLQTRQMMLESLAPRAWTPERVSERLIEAFRIDARMPRIERPKAPGSAHPTIEYDNDDRAEWQTEKIDESKFRPSIEEEEIAAEAFSWLLWVRVEDRLAATTWAKTTMKSNSLRTAAKKAGLHEATLRKQAKRAFSSIASRLNAASVPCTMFTL